MSDTYQTDTPRALNAEQTEIIGEFLHLLRGPTQDGRDKRERRDNPKPLWKEDPDHWEAFKRHIARYEAGERIDRDSGCSPLVHAAWRLLACAWIDEHG